MTLVEVVIAVAIIGLVTGLGAASLNMVGGARLRKSAVTVASAVRVAYGRANATSKVVRLVFDLDKQVVQLEEESPMSRGQMKIVKNDMTGGAAAATEAERKAVEDADQIMKGPRAPRPTFQPVSTFGFDVGKGQVGKELERGIRFLQVETGHQDDVVVSGRTYLYFWPGGITERAAIQLGIFSGTFGLTGTTGTSALVPDTDVLTIVVSPLTGKAELRKGRANMPRPRDDIEGSERRDSGY
ncbi:MAG: prepilin-type cleavage/methylation domain-containing protein [Byssovorax sp.]